MDDMTGMITHVWPCPAQRMSPEQAIPHVLLGIAHSHFVTSSELVCEAQRPPIEEMFHKLHDQAKSNATKILVVLELEVELMTPLYPKNNLWLKSLAAQYPQLVFISGELDTEPHIVTAFDAVDKKPSEFYDTSVARYLIERNSAILRRASSFLRAAPQTYS